MINKGFCNNIQLKPILFSIIFYFFFFLISCTEPGNKNPKELSGITDSALAKHTPSDKLAAGESIKVYKYDGSKQCQNEPGINLKEMEKELKSIQIISSSKASDGLMHAMMCGSPTGTVNLFEIPKTDLNKALSAGFKQWEIRKK